MMPSVDDVQSVLPVIRGCGARHRGCEPVYRYAAGDSVAILDAVEILSNERGITDSRYSKDFLHLNETGYEVLNRELIRILQP